MVRFRVTRGQGGAHHPSRRPEENLRFDRGRPERRGGVLVLSRTERGAGGIDR